MIPRDGLERVVRDRQRFDRSVRLGPRRSILLALIAGRDVVLDIRRHARPSVLASESLERAVATFVTAGGVVVGEVEGLSAERWRYVGAGAEL